MSQWIKKKKPAGFEAIEPTLNELENKMREAERAPHDGKRKQESIWPIFQIHHQRSRYIWESYKRGVINREVYDYCIRNKLADQNLIAMWKKKGYEKLCCLQCAQNDEHNFKSVCICRVPKANLPEGKIVECCQCGCRGCASGDGSRKSKKREVEDDGDETRKRIELLRSMMEAGANEDGEKQEGEQHHEEQPQEGDAKEQLLEDHTEQPQEEAPNQPTADVPAAPEDE
ncbi:hypothetical protein WA538_000767 [Blastocystis sp. DL]